MLSLIRGLRHGPLRFLGPLWTVLGHGFRWATAKAGWSVQQKIGPYGPFRLDARFAFSDLSTWGTGHNDGFRACIEACRGKNCIIDIGAHVGLVALPAASVLGAAGQLVAFEPAAANAVLLKRHLELNGLDQVVRIENVLVGRDNRADAAFFEMDDATGMNSVVPGAMNASYRPVERKQLALDSYCAERNLRPEVIKIDVEGAEIAVLEGARAVIENFRPLIFLSVHPRQLALLGESTCRLKALVDSMNYSFSNADRTPATTLELREYILTPKES